MKDPILSEDVHWLAPELVESFIVDIFKSIGVPETEAAVCADVLVAADMRGIASHGVSRLKPIYYDRIVHKQIQSATTEFEIVRDRGATAVVDGHHGMGMVIARRSMEMAIEKARQYGIGAVAVRNSTHFGIAAYYSMMATDADMIGMTSTNARPAIAPTLGVENMLGTNPLVFGFPTDDPFPFVNDYATSIIQRGTVEIYARENRPLPDGVVIDHDGNSKTDPNVVLQDLLDGRAALAPIGGSSEETGGYKGYGFATVAELLSCALQQGMFLKQLSGFDDAGDPVPHALGHFFMATDVSAFTDPAAFKKTAGDMLRALRASRKAPGQDRIYTCGEKEYDATRERAGTGIPVNRSIQQEMITMRDEQGLSQYRFEFE